MTSSVIASLFQGRPKERNRPESNPSITSRSYLAWLVVRSVRTEKKVAAAQHDDRLAALLVLAVLRNRILKTWHVQVSLGLAKRNLPFVTKVNAALPNAGR